MPVLLRRFFPSKHSECLQTSSPALAGWEGLSKGFFGYCWCWPWAGIWLRCKVCSSKNVTEGCHWIYQGFIIWNWEISVKSTNRHILHYFLKRFFCISLIFAWKNFFPCKFLKTYELCLLIWFYWSGSLFFVFAHTWFFRQLLVKVLESFVKQIIKISFRSTGHSWNVFLFL